MKERIGKKGDSFVRGGPQAISLARRVRKLTGQPAAEDPRVTALTQENERLREALRWFLKDPRFQVAVSGNPIAIDRMLAEARAALAKGQTP